MLLILFPFKFTDFYYYLLDIDKLKKNIKLKIEIHDISYHLNKDLNKGFLAKPNKSVKKFDTFKKWQKRFDYLNKKNDLVIFNFLDFKSFSSLRYFFYLKKNNLKLLRVGSAGILQQSFKTKKNFSYYYNNFVNLNFLLKKIIFLIKTKVIILLYKNFFRLSEILLVSGNKNQKIFKLSNSKKIVYYHSLDYNKAIQFKNYKFKTKRKKNKIIYFDMPKPYFNDDFHLLYKYFPVNNDQKIKYHYSKLNIFLKSIKKIYSSDIVIVPHPKVRGIKNPYYDKSFIIDKRAEAASILVPSCKFVIYSSFSTSVAYAIANNKPILFLKGEGFEGNYGIKDHYKRGIETMSKYLSCDVFDYKDELKDKINLNFNKKRYDSYKYQFLTNKKIEKINNYQIIKELIKK